MRSLASIWLNLFLAAASAASAQSPESEVPCRLEASENGQAACLGRLAEEAEARMEARIGETLAGLQAARAGELRALGRRYRDAQAAWRAAVRQGCGTLGDPVEDAACRLDAARAREPEVEESLARAAAELGGAGEAGILIGGEIELYVPLRLPGDRTPIGELPVLIPILP